MNAIEIHGLTKRYGSREVLHGIDLQVGAGRLVGFLGPNGAGKTTTVRILLGLIRRSAGRICVLGHSEERTAWRIRSRIGYLAGDVHFYSHLTGLQNLQFFARARHLNCDSEIQRLGASLKLELDKAVRKYSSGMKQKLGLIQALMHRPELLILDEPTSGLDPLIRKALFAELKGFVADGGRTVLFSSHTLSEVDELCDDVIILRAGHVVEQTSLNALRQKGLRRVKIAYGSAAPPPGKLPADLALISNKDGTIDAMWSGSSDALIQWLHTQPTADVIIQPPSLEDLFLAFYAGEGVPQ